MKRIRNRNIFILLTIILSLGITLGAVYFMYQYKDSRENELKTGMISLNFTEKSEVINLTSNVPMIDDLGLKSRPYEFTITNTSTVPIKANIKLDVDNDTTIKYGAVRYALFINDERVIKDYVHRDNLTLYEVSELKPNEVINCKLYFWIDYYYDYPGEIFKAMIKAVGESIDELQQEAITVTFDADGGTLNTTTKEVYYHGYYGELPTPTKEGYTFMGWNGKNMVMELTNDNYLFIDYRNRTSHEFKTENNNSFVRINGYQEATSIDTAWHMVNKNSLYFSSFNYILSFDVRSEKSIVTQRFSKVTTEFNGRTGIYVYNDYTLNGLLSNIEASITFFNDGNWYRVSSKLSFSSIPIEGVLRIGNDYPDICGIGSYIDITNIQIEEGTVATEYEPYYIKSNTKVVQKENHTLKAIWKENS